MRRLGGRQQWGCSHPKGCSHPRTALPPSQHLHLLELHRCILTWPGRQPHAAVWLSGTRTSLANSVVAPARLADKGKRPAAAAADDGDGGGRASKRPAAAAAGDGAGPSGAAGSNVPEPGQSSFTRLGLVQKTIKELQNVLKAWNLPVSTLWCSWGWALAVAASVSSVVGCILFSRGNLVALLLALHHQVAAALHRGGGSGALLIAAPHQTAAQPDHLLPLPLRAPPSCWLPLCCRSAARRTT